MTKYILSHDMAQPYYSYIHTNEIELFRAYTTHVCNSHLISSTSITQSPFSLNTSSNMVG